MTFYHIAYFQWSSKYMSEKSGKFPENDTSRKNFSKKIGISRNVQNHFRTHPEPLKHTLGYFCWRYGPSKLIWCEALSVTPETDVPPARRDYGTQSSHLPWTFDLDVTFWRLLSEQIISKNSDSNLWPSSISLTSSDLQNLCPKIPESFRKMTLPGAISRRK